METKNGAKELNTDYIVSAGKNLKNIFYLIILMVILGIISFLVIINTREIETIRITYLFMGIVGVVGNIAIAILLFSTGEDLEKSVTTYKTMIYIPDKKIEEPFKLNVSPKPEKKKKWIKYKCNQGVLEIEIFEINKFPWKGDKAKLNNYDVPDGKYKIGPFHYVHIENGIVLKSTFI